jgi:formamidopyrimidine-DNA glycosylase
MPELPDIEAYLFALRQRIEGRALQRIRIARPFLLRTVSPAPRELEGRVVTGVRRLGKRIVIALEGDDFIVLHLMIAGRLHWKLAGAPLAGKAQLAAFDFAHGSLTLTEAGTKRRASLHLIHGAAGLREHERGGLEVLGSSLPEFRDALTRENHTLKRALTDPRLFSGIGNAYSDEILHRARLSPVRLSRRLSDEEIDRLHNATQIVLNEWVERFVREAEGSFPEKVTAFRKEMAVHGKHGQPCLDCGAPVQRIVYAENECNYCANCQNSGRLLADRALSRLLREDWPRTLEELDERLKPQAVTSPVRKPGSRS